jgi:hypothetical protein
MQRSSLVGLFWIGLAITALATGPVGSDPGTGQSPSHDLAAPSIQDLLDYWQTHGQGPLDYILETSREKKWIFLGEYHRIKHDVELVSALIPALHSTTAVRHLALEFLCADRSKEANALLTASEYDRRRTIDFFRRQFPSWSYEEYLGLFEAAWRSNQAYSAIRGPFRLVGLHPCPSYEVLHYSEDEEKRQREQGKRDGYDQFMAETLERVILQPEIPALIFTGIAHSTAKFTEYRYGTDQPLPRMGNLVYREPYRDEMFFVALHAPFWDSGSERDIYPFDGELDRLMLTFGEDIGFDIVGTPFEGLAHRERSARSITAHTFGELYDGYVLHRTPLKEYVGVTCIEDWILDEAQFRHYWRNLSNKRASAAFSTMPFEDFKRTRCEPRPDHGTEFRRRFDRLPDLD